MVSRGQFARGARTLALIGFLSTGACVPFDNVMVGIFGRSMRDQPSFDPYENPLPPPAGAVPFSSGNYSEGPGQLNVGQHEAFGGTYVDVTPQMLAGQDAEGLALLEATENPVPADARSLARGEVLYQRNCVPCHGPTGQAAGAPVAAVWPLLLAYPLTATAAVGRSDAYIFGMITAGRGLMPAYGQRVPFWDRWDVVNYVRTLQAAAAPAAGATPDAAPGGGES